MLLFFFLFFFFFCLCFVVVVALGYINGKTDHHEQFYMPSRRNDVAACIVRKENWEEKEMHGKWMTFKHFDEIDATWKEIVTAMENNTLERCWVAKCSTLYYDPSSVGPGPTTSGVITVHTSKENIQLVGEQLISIVKHQV